ncbi:general transcription factor II-I repeat domain-containing protein 2-like [Pholidichthys leucotaenia]
MVDESNDKNTEKRLVILARIFDGEMSHTRLLDMPIPALEKATNIFAENDNFMRLHNIPWENVVGFASDNCNTMVGRDNSVLSRLKEKSSNVFSIGCICHLANLCVKAGVKALPMKLDDFLVDIFYFFHNSSKRLTDFKEFQQFTEVEEEKILQHCPTRWLSLEKVGNRTLSQLPALKSYFASHEDVEKPGKVKSITKRLHDPLTELLLLFMKFILPIINNFNTIFQADENKIGSLLPEMDHLLRKLLVKFDQMKYVKATNDLRRLDFLDSDLQHSDEFIAIGLETREALQTHELDPDTEQKFFEALRGFYEAVVRKMLNKFPFDDKILPHLSVLDPRKTQSLTYGPIVELAAAFCPTVDTEELKEEWEDLQLLPENTVPLQDKDGKPVHVDVYWGQVMALKTALDVPRFPQLLKVYSALLCLPHSNADSERAFSMARKIHTDFRKSMLPETLTSFMQVKMNCDTPCFKVKPSKEMLESAKAATWNYNKQHQ